MEIANRHPKFQGNVAIPRAKRQLGRGGGFTLVEVLIVVLLLGIVAATVIPNMTPMTYDQLMAAGLIAESELSYARSLAIANGSPYTVTFDPTNNRLVLTYSGTNTALSTLPPTPFRNPTDPANQQITAFSSLPNLQNLVGMVGGYVNTTGYPVSNSVQFGPLGNVVGATNPTVLYLYSGSGASRLYISISVDPVTGLATVGVPTGTIPVSFGG